MSMSIAYWVIMTIWFVMGLYVTWGIGNHFLVGGNVLLFILFVLLGWKVFGSPIHG